MKKRSIPRFKKGSEPDLIPWRRRTGGKGCLRDIVSVKKRVVRKIYAYEITLSCGHKINRNYTRFHGSTGRRADCLDCKP